MYPSQHRQEPQNSTRDRAAYGSTGRLLGEEVDRQYRRGSQPSGVFEQIRHLGVDFITLAELQGELLRVDSRDAMRQLVWPIVLSIIGIGFIVGCFPLAVFGVSWWLADKTELTLAGASLLVSGCGLVISAAIFYGAWRSLTRVWEYFNRSREEFKQNLDWVKRMLAQRH